MQYRYLEDIALADVAFEASGGHLEELFLAASRATVNTMIERLESLEPRLNRDVSLSAPDLDLLLFAYLQELIFFKDAEGLLLLPTSMKISANEEGFSLEAVLFGEEIDQTRHEQRADVKSVTLHQFKVEETEKGWCCQVILDV